MMEMGLKRYAIPKQVLSVFWRGRIEGSAPCAIFVFVFFYSTVSATAFHCLWPIDSHPFCVGYVLVVFFSYRVMLCDV